MRLGRNERAIQAKLNIGAGLAVMRNWVNLVLQETLSYLDADEAEAFITRMQRETGIEYRSGYFYVPTGVWDEEGSDGNENVAGYQGH